MLVLPVKPAETKWSQQASEARAAVFGMRHSRFRKAGQLAQGHRVEVVELGLRPGVPAQRLLLGPSVPLYFWGLGEAAGS